MVKRSIRGSLSRFLAILCIIALGAGFLAGLLSTTPDMEQTADDYYHTHNAYDYDVKGTLGLTNSDISALKQADNTDIVMPVYQRDLVMEDVSNSEKYTSRVIAYDFSKRDDSDFINKMKLKKGRWPKNSGECVIEVANIYSSKHKLGETLSISKDNKDLSEVKSAYSRNKYKVVGIVMSPLFESANGEITTAGDGKVMLGVYISRSDCKAKIYTDAYVILKGSKKISSFSGDYSELISDNEASLKTLGKERSSIRSRSVIGAAQKKVDKAKKKYEKAKAQAASQLDSAKSSITAGKNEINASKAKIKASRATLKSKAAKLDAQEKKLDKKSAELDKIEPQIDALKQLRDSGADLTDEQKQAIEAYDSGRAQIKSGRVQISSARKQIRSAEEKLDSAEATIAASAMKLSSAEKSYETAKAKADKSLASAKKKLQDGQDKVDKIKNAKWYLSARIDSIGFSNYKSDVEKVAAVAKVFPVFFFLVAILVALTTMTRLIEEQRELIGTLKSLGYGRRRVLQYYMTYALSASIIGCVIGLVFGFAAFPKIIGNAYTMMYNHPATQVQFIWSYAIVITVVMVAVTAGTTYWACAKTMREKPAQLLLPKAPDSGKRILLEKIGFIWNRLSFTHKVTCRNIFRYKKRFLMTIIGVAGCFALLLAGFGIRDSIGDIVNKQYNELFSFDYTVELSNLRWTTDDSALSKTLGNKDEVKSYTAFYSDTVSAKSKSGKKYDITMRVPKDTSDFTNYVNMRERKSGDKISFNDNSAVINEKMADNLGLKKGSDLTVTLGDNTDITVKITGITENYVASYLYLSNNIYVDAVKKAGGSGSQPAYKDLLVKKAKGADTDTVMTDLLKSARVTYVYSSDYVKTNFADSVKSINYIVYVLIVSAGALAMIVLYNLTNVNVCERKKELATIKVLGFYEKEVSSYIFREINILAVIGMIFGVPLGVWLHKFIIKTVEVDTVMFGQSIEWPSFFYAAGLTILFTLLVNLIMRRSIRNIDMVESMKAND